MRGLVQPEHRQHTPHGRELGRHRNQQLAPCRIAEVQVDVFLDLGQRGAQLLHHAAHGLAVGDPAVELLHPKFERARVTGLAHRVDALGQSVDALGAVGVVKVPVIERGIDVEQRGGHLHRQFGRRLGTGGGGVGRSHLQRPAQHAAIGIEPRQRVTDQRKLLGQAAQACQVTAGHGRPDLLGSGNPLARLRHPGRIKSAQPGLVVVDRWRAAQVIGPPHGGQTRSDRPVNLGCRLTAKEQQVMRQALGRLGVVTGPQLRQQLGADAFAVGIRLEQAIGLGLEEARRELPQRGQSPAGSRLRHRSCTHANAGLRRRTPAAGQAGKKLTHACGHTGRRATHQGQQVGLDTAHGLIIGLARCRAAVFWQQAPGPLDRPEIGRMGPCDTGQLLQGAVLRK